MKPAIDPVTNVIINMYLTRQERYGRTYIYDGTIAPSRGVVFLSRCEDCHTRASLGLRASETDRGLTNGPQKGCNRLALLRCGFSTRDTWPRSYLLWQSISPIEAPSSQASCFLCNKESFEFTRCLKHTQARAYRT